MTKLLLGPVLSFRGQEGDLWKVTALIGIAKGADVPVVTIDETRKAAVPVELLRHGGNSYLRYDLSVQQGGDDRRVAYSVAGVDEKWHFTVPGKGRAPRMAYVSCNGFSDANCMRKLIKAEGAVWEDLVCNHDKEVRPSDYRLDKEQLWHERLTNEKGFQRFHLLLMGGDQIYFDSIWEDVKLLEKWIGMRRKDQLNYSVTPTLDKKIEDYYFGLYCKRWLSTKRNGWGSANRSLDAAMAMATMPTVMMWDDHDIFDGWGSYSPEMQRTALFQRLFHHARRAFWVFQMQHALDDLPPLQPRPDINVSADDPLYQPIEWLGLRNTDKLALPLLDDQPGFSFAHSIGPVSLVVADLRTERSGRQVLGPDTWTSLQRWLGALPGQGAGTACHHLLFLSSVPVVHPKLSLAEEFMDHFGSDHVLDSSADDLKDHWTNGDHEGERVQLVETLLQTAKSKNLKVTIVSGDVHVAAWGTVYRKDVDAKTKWAQIQQLTSTAVVHPSLVSVAEKLFFYVLNKLAKDKQALNGNVDAEMMIFPGSSRYVMAARNWLAIELDEGGSIGDAKLWATWRCETKDAFTNHLLAIDSATG